MQKSEVKGRQESSLQSDAGFADELSCPICLEIFQNPVQLPCLHNFCQDCLQIEFQHNQTQSSVIPFGCPTCRQTVPLSEGGVKNLPKNFNLSGIVEKYRKLCERKKCAGQKESLHSSIEEKAVNQTSLDLNHTCSEHSKPVTLFCSTCMDVMCTKCVSKHRTHDFEDIEDKYEKYVEELQRSVIPSLTEARELLMSSRKTVDDKVHSIKHYRSKSWDAIAAEIQTLKEHLNQKQKELEVAWQEQEDRVLSPATEKQKQMEAMLYNIAELQAQAQALTEVNPVCFVMDFKKVKNRVKDVTSLRRVDVELQTSEIPGLTAESEVLESLKGVKEKILNLHLHDKPVLSSSKTEFDTVQISEKSSRKVTVPHQSKRKTMVPEKTPIDKNASKSQQLRIIKKLKQKVLCEGDVLYLIESKWYDTWKAYVMNWKRDNPGPIDNSLLLNEDSELLPHLVEEEDFIALPEEAWECLVTWYGHMTGQEPIKRSIIMQGLINKKLCLELYPLTIHLSKQEQGLKTEKIQRKFSESCTLQFLKSQVTDTFHLKSGQKFQVFVSTKPECKSTWMNLCSMSDSCSLQEAGITNGSTIIVQL